MFCWINNGTQLSAEKSSFKLFYSVFAALYSLFASMANSVFQLDPHSVAYLGFGKGGGMASAQSASL